MKRKFVKVMLFGALALSTVTYVGCKDYDDDINNLQTQIDAVKVSLDELQAKVNSGSVITNVAKGENGVIVTLSDGKNFELTNGEDGAAGTNAAVWTIGGDGLWYKDGVKTQYKAVGVDGSNGSAGADGADGVDGVDGQNGQYYVPNKETGLFDIWKDNKFVESTNTSWKAASEDGMTAVLIGNVLTLSGVEGAEGGTIDLVSGIALASVAFIPDVVSSELPYATTTGSFYHLVSYLDEAKYNADAPYQFTNQSDWGKSNLVAMYYRLNPQDAFVDGKAVFGFINRKVTTRATGDMITLLNVANTEVKDGVVEIDATINPTALVAAPDHNIAALQAWYGQNPMTSDYVHVTSSAIDALLADTVNTVVGEAAKVFYPRTSSIAKGETDAFIKQFVALSAPINVAFKYTGSIDLKEHVGLYSNDKVEWIAALGFRGMSYEFSIPEKYLATDDDKTNQQWFITKKGENTLENGEIEVNPEVTNATPAVGRTPVVRVDAFLTSNAGVKKLVASSYIKIDIIEKDVDPGQKPPYDPIQMSAPKAADYHKLMDGESAFTNEYTLDNVNMDYQAINNKIYGTAKLTSTTFWNYYGGVDRNYNVSVTVTDKNDQEVKIIDEAVSQRTDVVINQNGVLLNIKLNDNATTTSAIKVGINNKIKSQNTYKDVDGKGAKYTVTIKIVSNDNSHGDIKLDQVFYVKEKCVPYTYNPLYYNKTYTSLADGKSYSDCIVIKGQNTPGYWEMSSVVSEHFAKVNGQNIFAYYNTVNNVKTLDFQWAAGVTNVTPNPLTSFNTDQTVKLTAAMTKRDDVKNMTYKVTLINDETCDFNYNIVFVNPFVAGTANAVNINGNGIGENKGETMPQVLVKDNESSTIYSYVTNALALSDKAKNTYKLTASIVSVKYEFVENAAWDELTDNMSNDSELSVDAANGTVVWKNQGSTLVKDYNLTVNAVVTFQDLSVVTCKIPVNLTK